MQHQSTDETVNRFTIAAAELLKRELDPQFAADTCSVAFVAGPPLSQALLDQWTFNAKATRMDIVYLAYDPGRECLGPTSFTILAERWGAVFRWTECALWAPRDGGPALLMPQDLNVCFGHDGKALISLPARPTKSLANGVERARIRLMGAARKVTVEQLEGVNETWRRAA